MYFVRTQTRTPPRYDDDADADVGNNGIIVIIIIRVICNNIIIRCDAIRTTLAARRFDRPSSWSRRPPSAFEVHCTVTVFYYIKILVGQQVRRSVLPTSSSRPFLFFRTFSDKVFWNGFSVPFDGFIFSNTERNQRSSLDRNGFFQCFEPKLCTWVMVGCDSTNIIDRVSSGLFILTNEMMVSVQIFSLFCATIIIRKDMWFYKNTN